MRNEHTNGVDVNHKFMLIKLTTQTADALEDFRYQEQKQRRCRVTKRELVEQAIQALVKGTGLNQ